MQSWPAKKPSLSSSMPAGRRCGAPTTMTVTESPRLALLTLPVAPLTRMLVVAPLICCPVREVLTSDVTAALSLPGKTPMRQPARAVLLSN